MQSIDKIPFIGPNVPNKNGRCKHNMVPKWCALCNPVDFKERAKREKEIRTKSMFIFVVIDGDDGQELARFYDKHEAIAARDEIRAMMDDPLAARIDIIDNPDHPSNKETDDDDE